MRLQRIHEAVHYRPWFISPSGYASVRALLDKAESRPLRADSDGDDDDGIFSSFVRSRPSIKIDPATRTATIFVFGVLGPHLTLIEKSCGNTSYQDIQSEIAQAIASNVERINFIFDSPGGTVTGCDECAKAIAAIKDEADILTVAFTDTLMCSAAYYLASGCSAIVATRTATVGNIGVICPWVDESKMWELLGLEFQPITNDGADLKSTMHGPSITDEQRAFLQQDVNSTGEMFQDHVLSNRPQLDAEVFRAGWYSGERAESLGLVDMIGDLSTT